MLMADLAEGQEQDTCPHGVPWAERCYACTPTRVGDDETLTVAELREALRKASFAFQSSMYAHGMIGWLIWPEDGRGVAEDPADHVMSLVRQAREAGP